MDLNPFVEGRGEADGSKGAMLVGGGDDQGEADLIGLQDHACDAVAAA